MRQFILFFLLSTQWLFAAENQRLVVIYGASCAGKSTLSNGLQEALGDAWVVIDRDEVIDQETKRGILAQEAIETIADKLLCNEIHSRLNAGKKVIVDTQIPRAVLHHFSQEKPLAVFVYAPLPSLIARDARRAERLNRSQERNLWARHYLLDTYASLISRKAGHGKVAVEETGGKELDCELFRLPLSKRSTSIFLELVRSKQPKPIFSRYPCHLLIKSDQEPMTESVSRCLMLMGSQ